ncbi:NADPH-dependent FMN reductase [Dongia sp.]|uniref:NADPH-dependent FMN reductase n=1 Tax=Dongia sp. TaxID=1977262 RepID=UPI0035B41838
MLDILALSGSLRAASLNTALLRAAALLAPSGMEISIYDQLAALPAFNPDIDPSAAPAVMALLSRAAQADALLIACPEYARGIPGAFKNALDWLVGSPTFSGKPIALFNASQRATEAQAALRLVLQTMALVIVEPASITVPLPGPDTTPTAIAADGIAAPAIARALAAFADAIGSRQD